MGIKNTVFFLDLKTLSSKPDSKLKAFAKSEDLEVEDIIKIIYAEAERIKEEDKVKVTFKMIDDDEDSFRVIVESANVKYKGTIIYPYNKIKSDDFEFELDSVCGTITLVNKKADCKKISVTIDGAALDIFSMKYNDAKDFLKELSDRKGKKGYIEYRDGWQKLARWIREKYIPSREAVDDLVRDTWEKLASGEDYSRTYLWLAGEVLFLRGEKELLALAKLLRGANDHTRMRVHRGFTPMELRIRENNDAMFIATFVMPGCTEAALKLRMTRELLLSAGLRVDLEMTADKVRLLRNGNSLTGEEAAEEKIVYPRDPCPCGSGRTYADCCGWKQARPDYKEA